MTQFSPAPTCDVRLTDGYVFFENGSAFAKVYCYSCDCYHELWVNRATYYRPDAYQFNQKPLPYLREKACCYYCGIGDCDGAGRLRVDHIIPQSKGGDNGNRVTHELNNTRFYDNLVFCCRFCNSIKGAKSIEEARPSLLKRRAKLAGYQFPGDPNVLAFEETAPA